MPTSSATTTRTASMLLGATSLISSTSNSSSSFPFSLGISQPGSYKLRFFWGGEVAYTYSLVTSVANIASAGSLVFKWKNTAGTTIGQSAAIPCSANVTTVREELEKAGVAERVDVLFASDSATLCTLSSATGGPVVYILFYNMPSLSVADAAVTSSFFTVDSSGLSGGSATLNPMFQDTATITVSSTSTNSTFSSLAIVQQPTAVRFGERATFVPSLHAAYKNDQGLSLAVSRRVAFRALQAPSTVQLCPSASVTKDSTSVTVSSSVLGELTTGDYLLIGTTAFRVETLDGTGMTITLDRAYPGLTASGVALFVPRSLGRMGIEPLSSFVATNTSSKAAQLENVTFHTPGSFYVTATDATVNETSVLCTTTSSSATVTCTGLSATPVYIGSVVSFAASYDAIGNTYVVRAVTSTALTLDRTFTDTAGSNQKMFLYAHSRFMVEFAVTGATENSRPLSGTFALDVTVAGVTQTSPQFSYDETEASFQSKLRSLSFGGQITVIKVEVEQIYSVKWYVAFNPGISCHSISLSANTVATSDGTLSSRIETLASVHSTTSSAIQVSTGTVASMSLVTGRFLLRCLVSEMAAIV